MPTDENEKQLVIPNGVTSSGLVINTEIEVLVLDGGTLLDSIVSAPGYITAEKGSILDKITVSEGGDLAFEGTATNITVENKNAIVHVWEGGVLTGGTIKDGGNGAVYADAIASDVTVSHGGKFLLYGGSANNTVVENGAQFTIQETTGLATLTTIKDGALVRVTTGGTMQDTTMTGGNIDVLGGSLVKTEVEGGTVHVDANNKVEDFTINAGNLELDGAQANLLVINGGTVSLISSGTIQNTTMNGGLLSIVSATVSGGLVNIGANFTLNGGAVLGMTVDGGEFIVVSASAADTVVKNGTADFTETAVTGIEIENGGSAVLDSESSLSGKASFEEGATITIDGTVTFDTAYSTISDAQIQGFSAISGDTSYTLTTDGEIGVYLLATGVTSFDAEVTFGDTTLSVGADPVKIDGLYYTLSLTDGNLTLTVDDVLPPAPGGDVTIAYVNSEWSELAEGTVIMLGNVAATVGVNAFANGDQATEAVTADGKIRVTGGNVTFASGISKDTTVFGGAEVTNSDVAADTVLRINKNAILTGNAVFAEGAGVIGSGTILFDTAAATATEAQFQGFSAVDSTVALSLNVGEEIIKGTYLLASGVDADFAADVELLGKKATLTVGEPSFVDGYSYSLTVAEGDLVLKIDDRPIPALVYVNSEWCEIPDEGEVYIGETVATVGYDAFATGDKAVGAITVDGSIMVVGGRVSFSSAIRKSATIAVEATLVGKATFDTEITVDGTIEFDTAFATETEAQFTNFSNIAAGETVKYTLNDSLLTEGDYLLATDAAGFKDAITINGTELTVGGPTVVVDKYTYTLALTGEKLILTVGKRPSPSLVYVNSEWEGLPDETQVTVGSTTAVIGYDAFAAGDGAAENVSEKGTIQIVKGKASFTVDAHDVLVNSGTVLDLNSVVTISGTTVKGGGKVTATGGAIIDGLNTSGHKAIAEVTGATVKNAVFKENGTKLTVGEAGLVQSAQVQGAATAIVTSGGSAEVVTLAGTSKAQGVLELQGGTATKVTISSGGYMFGDAAGTYSATDVVISKGGSARLNAGSKIVVLTSGLLDVAPNGPGITGGTVGASALMNVLGNGEEQGSAFNTVVQSGGSMIIAGGYASSTRMLAGGKMTVESGGTAADTEIRSKTTLNVSGSGAVANGFSLVKGGTMTVIEQGKLTGKISIGEGASVNMSAGTILEFDISEMTEPNTTALLNNLFAIKGSPSLIITVSADHQAVGTYQLAAGAAKFSGSLSVVGTDGSVFGDVSLNGEAVGFGDYSCTIALDGANLSLTVVSGGPVPPEPPHLAYVNSEWKDKKKGAIVTVEGGTAKIGYDAFATGDEAVEAVTEDGSIEVVGGVATFTAGVTKPTAVLSGATISDTAVSGVLTVKEGAVITGNIAVNDGATITVNGTVAFDTAYTKTGAQFIGLSSVQGTPTYTLNDSVAEIGNYLLATGAAGFSSPVSFNGQTLTVGGDVITVKGLDYALTLTDDQLSLSVTEYIPVVQTTVYVNSEWAGKSKGDVVEISEGVTATIGVDAFSDGDTAYVTVAADGEVIVIGGTVSFDPAIGKTITVNSDATMTGNVAFTEGGALTVEGTFAFDTAFAATAQIADLSKIAGTPKYTLTDSAKTAGTYILAEGAAGFDKGITFNDAILMVGADPIISGSFTYALGLAEDILTLTVDTYVPPVIVPTLAYVNSKWTDKQPGDVVEISEGVTATIGYDAFTTGDPAIAAVTPDGNVEVVDGTVRFNNAVDKSLIVDASATLTGNAAFAAPITINGTVAFDTVFATEDTPQFTGYDHVTLGETARYTLTDGALTAGTYLLVDKVSGDIPEITMDDAVLTVGGEPVAIGIYSYAVNVENDALVLTVAELPGPGLVYVNSAWYGKTDGEIVEISEGVTATIGTDAFAYGDDAFGAAADDGAIAVIGGTVSFSEPITKTLTVSEDSTLTGKAVFGNGVSITVNGTIAFNTEFTVDGAQFTNISNVSGATKYTLTAETVTGTYKLASGAAGFNAEVQFNDYTLKVGEAPLVIGDLMYELSIVGLSNTLVLKVAQHTEPTNGPDGGWNDWLYENPNKKGGRGENQSLVKQEVVPLNYDSTILLDEDNTIYKPADDTIYHNFVGKVTGFEPREIDPADYAKIVLETGAQLQFSIDSQIAGKFIIYSYDEETHKVKALQTTNVKLKNNVPVKDQLTKAKLFEAGTYYISMQGTIPKKTDAPNGFYDVALATETHFFLDDDDNKNDWLYEKGKKGRGLNPDVAGEEVVAKNISRDSAGKQIQVDTQIVEYDPTGEFNNFVGFGDVTDYVKIHIDTAANLSLTIQCDKAAKLMIYQLTYDKYGVVNGAKALQTTKLKANKGEAASALKLLQTPGDYYIAVTSTNAKKGDEAYYNVTVNEQSIFYDNCDDHTNDWLYEGGKKGRGPNTDLINSAGVTIVDTMKNVQVDKDVPTGEPGDWHNFVGFDDTDDYQKIIIVKANATVSFKVDAKDQAKFVIYSYDKATNKMKALQTSKLKKDGDIYTVTTAAYTFATAGEYYIAVTSTNAKKGGNAYYNVELVSTNVTESDLLGDALTMPEISSGLNLTDDLSFAQYDADALAGASAGSLAELNDKSAWRNIARLA